MYALPGFTKLGCFADSWDRMLPNLLATSGAATAAKCSALADTGGFGVWALQNSNQCWAGSDVARATSLGASAACTKTCYGDPTGDCGARGRPERAPSLPVHAAGCRALRTGP